MEPAVRGARIEPTIVATRLERRFWPLRIPNFQIAKRPCVARNGAAGNGIFGHRDRRPKINPSGPLLSAETGNSKIGVKNTRRNGLFLIGDGFRTSGRLG